MTFPVYWQTYGLQNPNSGVFYYAHQIYESLRLAGIDPIMVGSSKFAPSFVGAKILEAKSNGILGLVPKLSEPFISQQLLNRAQQQNGRSIFHGLSNFNIPTVNRCAQTAYVLTVHDLIPLIVPDKISKSWAIQAKRLIPLAAKRADKIVCVSEWTKQTIIEKIGIAHDKIAVIPISIVSRVVEKPFQQNNKIKVLMVARDEAYKRLDLACKIAEVGQKKIDMMIVTDSLGKARIEKKFQKLIEGRQLQVKSNQSKGDLDQIYRRSDVVLNTSLLEGFGIPIADALSFGIPTVITAGSGTEEFLSNEFAKIMSPKDSSLEWVNAIEEAFLYLKSDSWYDRIRQHIATFDTNNMIGQRYLSLYENLL